VMSIQMRCSANIPAATSVCVRGRLARQGIGPALLAKADARAIESQTVSSYTRPILFNTCGGGPVPGGAGLPFIIVMVFWTFIVPSGSIERLSTRVMKGAVIVVTSTSPSHVLV
jgi:hypothetical protein